MTFTTLTIKKHFVPLGDHLPLLRTATEFKAVFLNSQGFLFLEYALSSNCGNSTYFLYFLHKDFPNSPSPKQLFSALFFSLHI